MLFCYRHRRGCTYQNGGIGQHHSTGAGSVRYLGNQYIRQLRALNRFGVRLSFMQKLGEIACRGFNRPTPEQNQFDLSAVPEECFRFNFRSRSGQNSFMTLTVMSMPSWTLRLEMALVTVRLSA